MSARALELWTQLSALYDEVEVALRDDGRGPDLAQLGRDIVRVESDLRPLVAAVGEYRTVLAAPSGPLLAVWEKSDLLTAELADRQPALTRAAIGARDGAAKALARVRSVRLSSSSYRGDAKKAPQFASRQA